MLSTESSVLTKVASVVALASALCATACTGDTSDAETVAAPTADAEQDDDPHADLNAREFYLEVVDPELSASCGVCHSSDADCTPRFMGLSPESSYDELAAHGGLLTHADSTNLIQHGTHTGPALTEFQEGLVRDWLTRERPDPPAGPTQQEALEELAGCMNYEDFDSTGMWKLAYQATDAGPCASCHKTGEAGTWIGYNPELMFARNTELPWVKRLVDPVFDGAGDFVGFEASTRMADKAENAPYCGSSHPKALVGADVRQALLDYFELTQARLDAGTCDTP